MQWQTHRYFPTGSEAVKDQIDRDANAGRAWLSTLTGMVISNLHRQSRQHMATLDSLEKAHGRA